jgi:probable phosphoglycerate mutase
MPTSVYLIRHGAYDHRPTPRGTEAAGDFGLSELGRAQVAALAARLAGSNEIAADHLYSSTLPRAVQTAEAIAPALGLAPVALPALCEWDSGNDVLGTDAFMARFHSLGWPQRRHHRFVPGFETMAKFTLRVQTALADLVARHDGQCTVLVVHGGVIEAAFHHFLGFGPGPFEGGYPAAGHTSITHWQRSDARSDWVQMVANDTHHLRALA